METNKFYYATTEKTIAETLLSENFTLLDYAVGDIQEELSIIINKEDKLFWISDQTNLALANEISMQEINQEILKTDLNTILSWLN